MREQAALCGVWHNTEETVTVVHILHNDGRRTINVVHTFLSPWENYQRCAHILTTRVYLSDIKTDVTPGYTFRTLRRMYTRVHLSDIKTDVHPGYTSRDGKRI